MVCRQHGWSSIWFVVNLVCRQLGLSSTWFFVSLVVRQPGLSSTWKSHSSTWFVVNVEKLFVNMVCRQHGFVKIVCRQGGCNPPGLVFRTRYLRTCVNVTTLLYFSSLST